MARYQWEAMIRAGEVKKGVVEAADETSVDARLRTEGLTPKRIKREAKQIEIRFGSGVTPKDLQIFTRQLATMIDAGLPLVQCLDILAQQSPNPVFGRTLAQVKSSVEQGATFSDALRKHPKIFDELYVNLIAAGEAGGILDTILSRLAVYIEKAVKLKSQVKSAMIYPISILVIAIGVIVLMLWKVIPVFEDMYKNFDGAKLPKPTQVVIKISHGFADRWYIFIGGLAALVFGITAMRRSPAGKKWSDGVLLKAPVFGSILRKIAVARFTRTLGTLLSSGVPILDALDICAKTAGNLVVQDAILFARARISEGFDMAAPLAETKVFPPMVVQMIGIGEQTGAMDQMLSKIADFYEEEVDVAVKGMTELIEPIMMAFLGIVVGGLIIAMYLPVFELAGNIDGG